MDHPGISKNQATESCKPNGEDQANQSGSPQMIPYLLKHAQNSCPSLSTIPQEGELVSGGKRQYSLRTCTLLAKNKIGQANDESREESVCDSESSYEFAKRKKTINKLSKKLKMQESSKARSTTRKRMFRNKPKASEASESDSESEDVLNGEPSFHDLVVLNKLPNKHRDLVDLQFQLSQKLSKYKRQFFEEEQRHKMSKSEIPELAIPISADVTKFNFDFMTQTQLNLTSQLFDVIMMDPPWQLSTSQPSRGVAIAYQSLSDDIISDIPIPKLQTSGFLFIWVINVKYSVTCKLMEKWGYTVVDEIAWIKKTVTGKIAKGHGFYLQHAKETCLVGVKVF